MEPTNTDLSTAKKSKWKKRLLLTFLTFILLFVGYIFICGMTYSSGARTGIVIKISQKGYVFKTYEGELNLGGISEGDGTIMPTKIWAFSVNRNDEQVFNELINTQGKHVRLHYREVIRNFFWQSETPYIVEKIEIVK